MTTIGRIFDFKEPPPEVMKSRFPSLDGLRAVSIIMVIAYHAFGDPVHLFSGPLGVSIFFVISGFLITTLLLKENYENGRIHLRNFYIRRFLRIFPVAWLYLGVLAVVNHFFPIHVPLASFASAGLYIRNTSIIFVPFSEWYTGHYWSLSAEEQFYLIFPFILSKGIVRYVAIAASLLLIIPLSNYAFAHDMLGWVGGILAQLLRNLGGLLIGSLFAIFYFFGKLSSLGRIKYKGVISLLLFLLAAAIHAKFVPVLPTFIGQFMIAIVIIINIEPADNFFYWCLNLKWLQFIGVLSYSLYIWQQMFTDHVPWANSFFYANNPWLNLVVLVLVSYVSYHYFEMPFLKLKNKFKSIP